MFKINNVSKIYESNGVKVRALNNISLEINEQEVISIVGPSGSGKTTLLNVMSTVDQVSAGSIEYNGIKLEVLSQKEASSLRLNKFGFIFQKYHLMPTLNIYDNIVLPVILANLKIEQEYMKELIEILDISSQLYKMPNQLSGGQQQRVAIARALIMKPEVIFADEPTGNLDSVNSAKVIQLFLECAEKYEQTLIYVTHDEKLASLANRNIRIRDGAVVA